MTEHITRWLEAYYDGELTSQRAQQVETHLETCETCQAELESLSVLTELLQDFPPAQDLTPASTFTAQVGLRLPRKPVENRWQNALRVGWQWAPAGLLATWVFIQTTFIVSGVLTRVLPRIPGMEQFASLLQSNAQGTSPVGDIPNLTSAGFVEIGQFGLDFLRGGGPLGWGVTLNLILTLTLGLLYLSWLASWWIQKSNGNKFSEQISS